MSMTEKELEKMGTCLVDCLVVQTLIHIKSMHAMGLPDKDIPKTILTMISVYADEVCEKITIDNKSKWEAIKVLAGGLAGAAEKFQKPEKDKNHGIDA